MTPYLMDRLMPRMRAWAMQVGSMVGHLGGRQDRGGVGSRIPPPSNMERLPYMRAWAVQVGGTGGWYRWAVQVGGTGGWYRWVVQVGGTGGRYRWVVQVGVHVGGTCGRYRWVLACWTIGV